ncbi:PilW family protein [Myxococcus sp. CA051A]|uniref:prepilin-type N-terminal cleavage/methylation domain-containing protein n=1 Tax=unclassified Myxococcus TaxID=2648731 RepID=UPI00157B8456|nr:MULTISPECIES: prepilin-type N-terminal cleavage/methylation domain-containing protein [unclassified Myxococcus]NTX39931.1 PilW family protein [Myxococcus sp. CA033]NTX64576.1 PilW family protein [Myxococcus sp. CA051A]
MSGSLRRKRGFTLLEVMISSAIGVIVLGVGLVVGMQMQRRALFEEQTMVAQVTGRAVKDLLTLDVQRAGIGMSNSPIQFADGDQRFAIQSWTGLDMRVATGPFASDLGFSLPTNAPYTDMASDVLQLFWGDPRSMISLTGCDGGISSNVRVGAELCTTPNPPTVLKPAAGPPTPILVANPTQGALACHFRLTDVRAGDARVVASPGLGIANTNNGPCSDPLDPLWQRAGWVAMRTVSAAYRVNWAGGSPALEYMAPGANTWAVVSRDVEQMTVRYGVINLNLPNNAYRWFPAVPGGTSIDQCTMNGTTACTVDVLVSDETPVTTNEELRARLRQRVREVEITLVIRTPRSDRSVVDPATINVLDQDFFPQDGFKRRTYTLRVTPRNFVSAGLQPAAGI